MPSSSLGPTQSAFATCRAGVRVMESSPGMALPLHMGTSKASRARALPGATDRAGVARCLSRKNHHAALPCLSGCEVCRQAIGLHSGEVSGGEDAGGQHLAWMRGGAEALEANLSEVGFSSPPPRSPSPFLDLVLRTPSGQVHRREVQGPHVRCEPLPE